MPYLIGRNAVLSALTLGVFGALVAVMVIGPSNRHSYSEGQCWDRYARAHTYMDTLAVDRLLFNTGTRVQTFCGTVRLWKEAPHSSSRVARLFQQ